MLCHDRGVSKIATKPRINGEIRIATVRLVGADGEMLGEMQTEEAKRIAAEAGLDLVEVGADARPPVCKIMDYGKMQYDRRKKQHSAAKKKVHRQQLKQIRLRAKIGQHDIDFKVRQARGFLERKDKVKFNVLFRGRENAHHDRGREILLGIVQQLQDVAEVERAPHMESGRSMSLLMTPKS